VLITRTPHRISILGGGTDIPPVVQEHGGLVLGGAIDKYAHITAKSLPPFHEYKSRVVYSKTELVDDHGDIQHGAVRACLEAVDVKEGVEIVHQADIPARSGTGSSSTFVVGLLHALYALKGKSRTPEELAREAIRIEREVLQENVGFQDQVWAAQHGGPASIRFFPDGTYIFSPLPLSADHLLDLERHLLLFFTNISRSSTEIAASYYGKLSDSLDRHYSLLRATEEGIDAVQRAQYERLGKLVDTTWRMKSALSTQVCPERVSDLYMRARLCGAFGGKLTGAGGGGCLLLIAPPERHQEIITEMTQQKAVWIPFRFCQMGSHIIFADRGC
jgi:D-glycero-alpha-D-manno-heptose-7-phosphate kinase